MYVNGGALVASHRKVHLFDIDIPGKIKFKVYPLLVLALASFLDLIVPTGERNVNRRNNGELF